MKFRPNIVIFLLILSYSYHTHAQSICSSKACNETVQTILFNMDPNTDPCNNFFKFACGGYISKTTIPDDKKRLTSFSHTNDQLLEQLHQMLVSNATMQEPKFYSLARDYYNSCINEEKLEVLGLQPINNIIKELGGWPIMKTQVQEDDSYGKWFESIEYLRATGLKLDSFVFISVRESYSNSSLRILEVDQPNLGLSKELWMQGRNSSIVKAYHKYMKNVITLFGGKITDENVENDIQDMLSFEEKLADISLAAENRRDSHSLSNPMSIQSLAKLDPNTPWKKVINHVVKKVQLNDDEIVNVAVPSYIENFNKLISVTPKRVQKNYLIWSIVSSKINMLNSAARNIYFNYHKELIGTSKMPERWRTCIEEIQTNLNNAIGAMYVRKYFSNETKRGAESIVDNIKKQFIEELRQSEWMDNDTKEAAIDKAQSIGQHIGYPSELLDDNKLDEHYLGLEFNSNEYFKNGLNLLKFNLDYSFSQLKQWVNKTNWVVNGCPAIVNAFYTSTTNSIAFPAGILQGVFFSNDRPESLNYGSFGWIVGHEITHGFDDMGSQFDKDGNLRNWWKPSTKIDFKNKSQCIVNQYSQYALHGLKLNGAKTQGENIADVGGIKFAYKAYEKWLESNPDKPQRLHHLKYTAKQLFWISAANNWCGKSRPEFEKQAILIDEHSPASFRVIGSFSNNPNFLKDFQCTPEKQMFPSKQCTVW